jgi:hypothetical protein
VVCPLALPALVAAGPGSGPWRGQAPGQDNRQAVSEAAVGALPLGQRLATASRILDVPFADSTLGRPGTRPEFWREELAGVRHDDVFPGVDLVYVVEGPRLEAALIVEAGVDLAAIHLDFPGLSALALAGDGDLVVTTPPLYSLLHRPRIAALNDAVALDLGAGWRRRGPEQVGVWAEGGDVTPVAVLLHFEADLAEVSLPDFAALAVDFGSSASMIDAIVGDDGDGLGDAGETIRYTTTMTNAGDQTAQNAQLDATLDVNTALVAGSLNISPLAIDDAYTDVIGNVTYMVNAASGVLDNDRDPPGANCSTCMITGFDMASANGGDVTLNADGSFTYDPPIGFTGDDTFTYTVQDNHGTSPLSNSATVTLTVADVVWFVDNSAGAVGDGRQATPFQTLAEAEAATGAGAVIRVRRGASGTTPYAGGITLKNQQELIGGGVDLLVGTTTVEAADGDAVIVNAGGDVVTLADGNVVEGVELRPTASAGIAANGANGGAVTDVTITIVGVGSNGIDLANSTGTFTFSQLTIGTATTTLGTGVFIDGGNADIDFIDPSITINGGDGLFVANTSGGAVDFTGGSITTIDGCGIDVIDAGSDVTIGATTTLMINGAVETPISVFGSTGPADNTATLTISGPTMVTTDNGAFPLITGVNTSGAINLSNATLTHSGGRIIDFDNVDGGASFTTTTVTNTDHDGVRIVDSGSTTFLLLFDNVIGAGTPATVAPLYLENNPSATISLRSLQVHTSGAVGVFANNSGTLRFTTSSSFVNAVNAGALSINSTSLLDGTTNPLVFASLTSVNAADGVFLNQVAGGLTVTGTTDIDSPTGDGIEITSSSGTFTFGATQIDDPGAMGLNINFNSGPASFASVAIDDTGGRGAFVSNNNGSVTISGGYVGETTSSATTTGGIGFEVAGGSGDVTMNAAIVNTANQSVFIGGKPGGTVTVNGAINDDGSGILLNNNNGATINFTGGLDLDTGTNPGFTATGGGIVTVTGANNTVDTTTGTGINIANTTLGAAGATFYSVSVNGAARGIILDSTGSSGFFEVTGDGASDPSVTTSGRTTAKSGGGTITLGSGGTIVNVTDGVVLTSADDVRLRNLVIGSGAATRNDAVSATSLIADNGIELTGTTDLLLDNVMVSQTNDHGIEGFGANSGLTLRHTEILNAGNDGAGPNDGDDAMDFSTGSGAPLTGTVLIESSVLAGMSDSGLELENFSGDLDLTVTDSFIGNNHHADGSCNPCEGDGLILRADGGSATIDLVVQDTIFNNVANDGIDIGNDHATNTSTLIVENTSGTNNSQADNLIDVANTDGTFRVRITDITSDASHRGTVLFFKADGAATTDVTINTSGGTPNAIQGSTIGDGIGVFVDGDPGTGILANGNARVRVQNTTLSNIFSANINLIVQDMASAAGELDVTIENVTTSQPTRGDDVIVGSVEAVAGGGGDGTLQLNIVDSVLGIGSVFLGTPLEALVMRGDRQVDVACNDDGNGGNGTPCTNIGTLTSNDTLIAQIMNENGNQITDGGLRAFVTADVFTSAALRNNAGTVLIINPLLVVLPILP